MVSLQQNETKKGNRSYYVHGYGAAPLHTALLQLGYRGLMVPAARLLPQLPSQLCSHHSCAKRLRIHTVKCM